MKYGKPSKIECGLTILCDGENVTIQVEDRGAHSDFLEIEVSPKDFTAALGRLSGVKCVGVVRSLDKVGKTMEMDHIEFEMPEHDYHDKEKVAETAAKDHCPEGWTVYDSFSSQSSFKHVGDKVIARATVRRWV